MKPIQNLTAPITLRGFEAAKPAGAQPDGSFKDFLLNSIREVNSMQQAADQAVEKLASGQDVNPAEVLTAVQKADLAFRMMMQIRNKIVQAYQEISRMPF